MDPVWIQAMYAYTEENKLCRSIYVWFDECGLVPSEYGKLPMKCGPATLHRFTEQQRFYEPILLHDSIFRVMGDSHGKEGARKSISTSWSSINPPVHCCIISLVELQCVLQSALHPRTPPGSAGALQRWPAIFEAAQECTAFLTAQYRVVSPKSTGDQKC